jgi:hypothetical protein
LIGRLILFGNYCAGEFSWIYHGAIPNLADERGQEEFTMQQ